MISRIALALFFIGAGSAHFLAPAPYLAIMPPVVPAPAAMVAISGGAEILGGIGVLFPPLRVAAGWGLIALLVVVFPANLYALKTGVAIAGMTVPRWALWARLPLQALFLFWVWHACLRPRKTFTR